MIDGHASSSRYPGTAHGCSHIPNCQTQVICHPGGNMMWRSIAETPSPSRGHMKDYPEWIW